MGQIGSERDRSSQLRLTAAPSGYLGRPMDETNDSTSYDLAGAARRCTCHINTIRRMVAAGQFPRPFYIGTGGTPRWRVEDVERWIAGGGVVRTKAVRGGKIVEVRGAAPAELRHRRTLRRDGLHARMQGGRKVLSGYGAVFYRAGDPGTEYELMDGVFERINPRAFDRTLREDPDVYATLNHDDNMLLGRTTAGTLRLSVDAVGLKYEIDLPDTPTGAEVFALASRGDLCGSSFSFFPVQSEQRVEDGRKIIERLDVMLRELGPVVSPAYTGTTTAAGMQRDRDMIAVQLALMEMDMSDDAPEPKRGRPGASRHADLAELNAVLRGAHPRCTAPSVAEEDRCQICGDDFYTCFCD